LSSAENLNFTAVTNKAVGTHGYRCSPMDADEICQHMDDNSDVSYVFTFIQRWWFCQDFGIDFNHRKRKNKTLYFLLLVALYIYRFPTNFCTIERKPWPKRWSILLSKLGVPNKVTCSEIEIAQALKPPTSSNVHHVYVFLFHSLQQCTKSVYFGRWTILEPSATSTSKFYI